MGQLSLWSWTLLLNWAHKSFFFTPSLLEWCFFSRLCPKQCFKTRPGPVGRSGTRPTRVYGWAGSMQKIGWELARPDPVGPGKPGWDPGLFSFFFSLFFCWLFLWMGTEGEEEVVVLKLEKDGRDIRGQEGYRCTNPLLSSWAPPPPKPKRERERSWNYEDLRRTRRGLTPLIKQR